MSGFVCVCVCVSAIVELNWMITRIYAERGWKAVLLFGRYGSVWLVWPGLRQPSLIWFDLVWAALWFHQIQHWLTHYKTVGDCGMWADTEFLKGLVFTWDLRSNSHIKYFTQEKSFDETFSVLELLECWPTMLSNMGFGPSGCLLKGCWPLLR